MSARSKEIIFLMGAGASAEAGIPTSSQMIGQIENLFITNNDWKKHYDLYNHVKSAIHFAAGLKGRFNTDVPYNIETLVNTLYELERNEEHPLYPFIASWNSRLIALAKSDFSEVQHLRSLILLELKKWMCPEDISKSDYYKGLQQLQKELNFPLRLFSLNYDLLVERLESQDFRVEAGFPGFGPSNWWDWERFEDNETTPNPLPQAFLYKLHGSINWKRDDSTKNLYRVEQVTTVEPGHMEVIFGRDFKLEAADPYLFYAYEFRRYSLIAKLIVTIGYSFGDAHINKILTQSLRDTLDRCIILVANCNSDDDVSKFREFVNKQLDLTLDEQQRRIIIQKGTAKQFFEDGEIGRKLVDKIPTNQEAPF